MDIPRANASQLALEDWRDSPSASVVWMSCELVLHVAAVVGNSRRSLLVQVN